ncbi:hypothetical protein Droror1_Dr00014859 [Drosera rotundifolia]
MSGLSWIVFASFFLLCYTPITSSSSFYKNTSRHLCVQADRFALLELKADLNLSNAWVEENDCCGWEGVTCNLLTGHVIQLAATPRPLPPPSGPPCGGTISPNSSLFLLHHLEVLDLSRNYIYSSLPPNINALSHLRYLNLSSNMIDGEIPTKISQLSQLISLDLSNNNINSSFPSNISALSHLRYLNLSLNSFYGEISIEINQLSRLTSLDLTNVYGEPKMQMPDLDKIVRNMTLLRELHQSGVNINSSFPDSLTCLR